MASQMATPSYTPEVQDEVDFMSMFMSQQNTDDMNRPQEPPVQYNTSIPTLLPTEHLQQVFESYPPVGIDMSSSSSYNAYPAELPYPLTSPLHITTPVPYKIEQPTPRPASAPSTVATPYAAPSTSTPPAQITSTPSAITTSTPSASGHASPAQSPVVAEPAPRQPGRRKRKLTPEDKRRICEVYRNSQGKIRQEDIAKEYSVDRSTISKILNQEERWLDPDAPGANQLLARRPGGRYPAIEEEMHRWLDEAVMHGREVRDSEAREEALRIGLRLGHPHFQASSKWWDGVKRRRVEEGRRMPTARRHALTPPMGMPMRSYSAMGMDPYMFPPMGVAGPSHYMLPTHVQDIPLAMRSRSQSSPQVLPGFASQPSSFGPTRSQRFSPGRHANAAALRQWTFPGAASSPGRPMSRNGSHQSHPSHHTHLSASAYGIAPQSSNELAPPAEISEMGHSMHVPALSQSSLSIAVSDTSDPAYNSSNPLSPDSPRTPPHANFTSAPMNLASSNECVDYNNFYGQYQQPMYSNTQVGCIPEGQYTQQPLYSGYEYAQPQW